MAHRADRWRARSAKPEVCRASTRYLRGTRRFTEPSGRLQRTSAVEWAGEEGNRVLSSLRRRARVGFAAVHSSHSVTNVGLAWMQMRLARAGPRLTNLCGVSGGAMMMSPGRAS